MLPKTNNAMKTFFTGLALALSVTFTVSAANTNWPDVRTENKPGVRWWWMGSAVDAKNLTWNLEQLSQAGIGSVEITPIYGVQGNDANELDYLSPKWMEMLKYTQAEAKRLNMQVDMNGATGWPFGGPQIDAEHAATKQFIQRYPVKALPGGKAKLQNLVIKAEDAKQRKLAKVLSVLFVGADGAREQISMTNLKDSLLTFGVAQDGEFFVLFSGKTLQQVKRAAPGGQGLVMDHLSKDALQTFLKPYDEAFQKSGASWPHSFFNDSYEVYGADWAENFLQEFKARRGYDLSDYLPEFLGIGDPIVISRIVCDYRETISDMLLYNFTIPWTEWAHARGSLTRNQAHGSPGQLLDLYAAMDIPECESFGQNRYDIPGLRVDERIKESDSNPVTLKFASSAAHVAGKPFTSCESMTWLTEHFRTSLSQIKPEIDQLFLNGINRVFYHGSPYTPKDAAWPGWLFYASIQVNPNNTVFHDMIGLNDYATRIQSFMQAGKPDNEVLVYLPIYDIWQNYRKGNYVTFDIHKISEKLPFFQKTIFKIRELGYDLDYVSDNQLQGATVVGNKIQTAGGKYKLILVPDCKVMPVETLKKLLLLSKDGATVAFLNRLPDDVPGLNSVPVRQEQLQRALSQFQLAPKLTDHVGKPLQKGWVMYGSSLENMLKYAPGRCKSEPIVTTFGASFIRRSMDDGSVYFFSQLTNKEIDDWVGIATAAKSAMLFNPMTGEKGKARLRNINGQTQVYLQLKAGQSILLRTFDKEVITDAEYPILESKPTTTAKNQAKEILLKGAWSFQFTQGVPAIPGTFEMKDQPVSWTTLKTDSASVYMGTGRYSLRFKLPKKQADGWMLDFGSINESARVYVNGQPAGICWSVPYVLNVGKLLKPGKVNTIDIDVTNLPANRIADYDRRGIKWRIFKEINFVDVLYKNTTYGEWPVMPSGLTQAPKLIPLFLKSE